MTEILELPIRVMALHALEYCERLFYLEEVEEIRVADERVFAGRELHETLELQEGEKRQEFELSSDTLGIIGKLDAVRHREGGWVVYEHKRGRPRSPLRKGEPYEAWDSDALQLYAYCMLLEEHLGKPITEGRIRYHAENITVRLPLDDAARCKVNQAVARARELRSSLKRPAVTANERLCIRCSLAPVCLPEEERLACDPDWEPLRLFPRKQENTVLHVTTPGARVGKAGDQISVTTPDGEIQKFPLAQIESMVIHGYGQVTTQALQLCVLNRIPVHWMSASGFYITGAVPDSGQVQRRIRQYEALRDESFKMSLAQKLVHAKVEGQLRYLLRATRSAPRSEAITKSISDLRKSLADIVKAESPDVLRGLEGMAGRAWFAVYPNTLLAAGAGEEFQIKGRSRRPPQDRYNALLSFGYALLHRSVMQALLTVGLEPAFGFYHTPRSAAHPLVLDLMELFRVPLCDMPVLGAVNRKQFDPKVDFSFAPGRVWLSQEGRKKAVLLYERRLQELWKHPVTGYSLEYGRAIELEARLLEKEWTGSPGLFARARLR
ncbi:MAG TPA: type I-MYXAN CRISPR-associated endonuclease Cas1 [Candidatus Hydrogenedentes bacterium]|jgi:CRISPR-associated protein Cas1|nr:MAG: CRISPR-associated protein Cas4/endonuclease Cas1 fusion [Candidatus Hydrogenedentes bacterium ADurb.Bin170]HOD96302.1 type I-MYXAN CRISPR-associated endonuclease Cas1 [Candidatus Hydrogenedentota bacterium]HOR51301.1 type I-MYXAN CRISPR-associated endonuclease Cas1 [Candidatus Hydrogenedentota bacterium]HPK25730.1 type I-MYXAN CRISPR-associated endonuclease Cas1 [Candidatus Hydrogenedentota bacterium]HPX87408.1 type I-MYXAN CRISPR-associated endonuclease Cas1 [Candidatus Hydrogenedentot